MSDVKANPSANEPTSGAPPTPRKWWERSSVQFAGMVLVSAAVISQAQTNPRVSVPQAAKTEPPVLAPQEPKKFVRLVPKPQLVMTSEAKKHLDLGNDFYRRKEYDRAIEEFTAAVRLSPDDAEAYDRRGLSHDAAGRVDEAITDFNTAVRLSPQQPGPLYHRGRVYSRLERFADAIADYTEALRLTSVAPEFRGRILYERAQAHFLSRAYLAASADCTAMLRLIPGSAEAYLLRGQATEAAGDPTAAVSDFREAKRLDPALYRAARVDWPMLPENP